MFTFLRKIQQRPEAQRRSIALWTAFWITLIIFGIWVTSFFSHLNQLTSAPTEVVLSEQVSPFKSTQETFSSVWGLFKKGVQNSFKK